MRLFIDALLFLDARAINSINPILTSKERYRNHHQTNTTNNDHNNNNKSHDGQNNVNNVKNENNNNNIIITSTQKRYALDSNFNCFKALPLFAMSNRMMNSLGPWLPVCTTFMSSRSVRLFEEFCPTLQYTTRISVYDIDRGVFRKLFLDDENKNSNNNNNEDSPLKAGISGLGRYLKTFESFITSKTLSEFHLFSSMMYLQNLSLHETKISTAATNDLRGIPYLKNLSLRRCYFNEIVDSTKNSANFKSFASPASDKTVPYSTPNFYKKLVVLEISQSKMTDEQLLHILVPTQYDVSTPSTTSTLLSSQALSILGNTLRELTLCDCINLSDKTCIEVIPKLKSLLGLDLSLSEEETATFNTQWAMTTMAATQAASAISFVCNSENCGLIAGGGLFFPPLDYGDDTDDFMLNSLSRSGTICTGHRFTAEFKRKSAVLLTKSNFTNVCSISPPYFSATDVVKTQGDIDFRIRRANKNGHNNNNNNNDDDDSPVCLFASPAVISNQGIIAILENLGDLLEINLQNRRLVTSEGFLDVLANISKTLDDKINNNNNNNNDDDDAALRTPRRSENDIINNGEKTRRLPPLRQIVLDGCFSINSSRCLPPRRSRRNIVNVALQPPVPDVVNPWRALSSALGPFLTTLSLAYSAITFADFQAGAFIGLYTLQELNLRGCILLDADAITGVVAAQSASSTGVATLPPSDLRKLDISLTRIPGNGAVMQLLKDFYKHSLEWLSMSNMDDFQETEVLPVLASGWNRLSYLDVSHNFDCAFERRLLHGPITAKSRRIWRMVVADPNDFFARFEHNKNKSDAKMDALSLDDDEIFATLMSDPEVNPEGGGVDILEQVRRKLNKFIYDIKIRGRSLRMFFPHKMFDSRVGFNGNGLFLMISPRLLESRAKNKKRKGNHQNDDDNEDVGGDAALESGSPKVDNFIDGETFLQETLQVLILDGNAKVESLVPLYSFYNLRILSLRHTGVQQAEIDALTRTQGTGASLQEEERVLPLVRIFLE